ncbi:alpha/beta fold hydrolase [Mycolicibacter longobardus]|uniref:Alpha/beta hydrolase n=1 Tax=Mycolicibacter longobardus TaxID=1108812 RepID=A0A1X1Y8E6_9MYCO|nr:alpha/beta hydrolase [Mycolicibacter longobardus]MCV7384101.1 alpha/beta hydrolase [Mycolicibacter longobardus]ORW07377.1 alpha/beta hydrolase [Mycolicibacter longobardus]
MTVRSILELPWGPVSYFDFRPDHPVGTVVLLHGGGVDSASLSWGDVGPRLAAAGFRVIAPDHPGFGHSPPAPWRLTQQRLVDYVGEFIDGLALDRYVIGGLSLGGGMALGHVMARPDQATGVMLLGSYGLMSRASDGLLGGVQQAVTWAMLRSGALALIGRWTARSPALLAWSVKTALIRDAAQRTPELMAEITAAVQQDSGVFEQWQRDEVRWNRLKTDYTPSLPSLRCPALILHGDKDTGVPVARARAAARLIPDARLVVLAGAGHWVQRDRPAEALAAMTEFLTRTG